MTAESIVSSRAAFRAQARRNGDWDSYLLLVDRPDRPAALLSITAHLDDRTYWLLAGQVWVDSETNGRWARKVLNCGRAGREAMMDDSERMALAALPEHVTIYRGYRDPRWQRGWSWTLSRARAEWYARRFACLGGTPRVCTGNISRSDVIAVFLGRSEDEVVADPRSAKIVNDDLV